MPNLKFVTRIENLIIIRKDLRDIVLNCMTQVKMTMVIYSENSL